MHEVKAGLFAHTLKAMLRWPAEQALTLESLGWATRDSYTGEVSAAVERLRRASGSATAAPWESVQDYHRGGVEEGSLWSKGAGAYVGELIINPADGAYIERVDPLFGALTAELMAAFLEADLAESGHERCPIGECQISSVVAVARYLNRDRDE